MSEEVHELQEHAEHAKHDPSLAPVTTHDGSSGGFGGDGLVVGTSHRDEEIVIQNQVTDQWAYYQAKNIRRHSDELFADLTSVIASKDGEAAAKLQEKYRAEAERYRDEHKELDAKAHELENEAALAHRKAGRFDLGEVFLEMALVITSITLLSGRRMFWFVGIVLGAAGVLEAASVALLH